MGGEDRLVLAAQERATSVAMRPSTRPSASTTCQARSISLAFGEYVRTAVLSSRAWANPGILRAPGSVGQTSVRSTPERMITLDDVRDARRRIAGIIRPTPVDRSASLSQRVGRPVLLKPEHLQRTGSFKIRGAYNLISRLPAEAVEVVAASAGNHAQGVALAASLTGRRADDLHARQRRLPEGRGHPGLRRRRAPRHDGGRRLHGRGQRTARGDRRGVRPAVRRSARHRRAGHGRPRARRRGARGRGRRGARRRRRPDRRGGDRAGLHPARRAGHRCGGGGRGGDAGLARRPGVRDLDRVATMADGIAVEVAVRRSRWPTSRRYVDDVVTVTEEEISRALLLLLERAKAVVEPAGAVGARGAARRQGRRHRAGGRGAVGRQRRSADAHQADRPRARGRRAAISLLRIVLDDRPGALAGPHRRGRRAGPQRAVGRASPVGRGAPVDGSRCSSRSRPAIPSTRRRRRRRAAGGGLRRDVL